MTHVEPLMQQNFLEYASYVIVDRAIPDLRDGCKPVQRRLLWTLASMDDGKFHKVANVIGESMKLHPHGDASIANALVVLANKEYFIEKQGNFGNILTGHAAAAARYIECRLTDLAKETLFNKALTTWADSYDGRRQEPIFLPAKLPVALLLGTDGIAVGMSTKILPHNFCELLRAQIRILHEEPVELLPDFPQGGLMDASNYDHGRGKVRVRARIDEVSDKKLVIREIPYGTTTESLIASIESAAQSNKVKISSVNDFTTDKVEIELHLARGTYADEVIPQLYHYTDCEVQLSSNIVVIHKRKPVEVTTEQVLKQCTHRLREQIKAELEHELEQLENQQHWLTLQQIFIENRIYKRIEKASTEEAVYKEVDTGMAKFKAKFIRTMTRDDVSKLLELRIRRISAFDIDKNHRDLDAIARDIKQCKTKLRNLTRTTVAYLEHLLKKFGDRYPRRTRLEAFESFDRKSIARQHLKVSYNPDTGFFGTHARGKEFQLSVSEYDLVIAISDDGTYRIMTTQEKVLLSGQVLYCDIFDPKEGANFTIVYQDAKKQLWAKRVSINKFIRNREYQLIKDKAGAIDMLSWEDDPGEVYFKYIPAGRQRNVTETFALGQLEVSRTTARGTKIAPRPVTKVWFPDEDEDEDEE